MINTAEEKPKTTIMVVDDQPNNLKVIASVLEHDYTLSFANNGINALKIIDKVMPQLILLDVMMPVMDGFEVCRKLKSADKTKEIPVIFLTAKTGIDDITTGFECGAVDYIAKPFNPREVKIRVENHLKLYQAQQEIMVKNRALLEAEELLQEKNSILEKMNVEKDKFFTIIAHDLRSPFNSILNLSEMILEGIRDKESIEEIETYAKVMNQASNKAFNLLNNLLEWAQAQTGRIRFSPEWLNIVNEIQGITELHLEQAAAKGITIRQQIAPGTHLFADRSMLQTILRNLLSNAIKFTHPGGIVTITAKETQEMAIISISDNGIGMDETMMKNIFTFNKVEGRQGTAGESSTGLGLILCKEFVSRHNGHIGVESQEQRGSTFSFSLPLPATFQS